MISDFFESPSAEFLDHCTKEQLLEIGKHYEIEIDKQRLKENIKAILLTNLVEKGVLVDSPPVIVSTATSLPPGLTFEQQKELLMLQIEIERTKLHVAKETRLSLSGAHPSLVSKGNSDDAFDVVGNLRLVPS